MPPFWVSIAVLSLLQGALVALPGAAAARTRALGPLIARLRGPRWALVPPAAVAGFVALARAAESASADALTYLALVAVPLLAALALGALARGAVRRRALLAVPLFALAWADRGGLAGEAAAVALTALSCAALGALIAAVTPPRWLAAGILAMALTDSALVIADLLQKPNDALNAAHPAAGLPRLQSALFGSAVMGYGDLFIAAALGGLLAARAPWRRAQPQAAALVALLALCFDLLFFLVRELPATVPVALALLLLSAWRRLRPAPGGPRARAGARPLRPPAPPARQPLPPLPP